MTNLEEKALAMVKDLLPEQQFEKMKFSARVGAKSFSIEFFVWLDGEKYQCYELADEGEIDEVRMMQAFKRYATEVRGASLCGNDEVKKLCFEVKLD